MSGGAIAMMLLSIIVLWGGLIFSIVRLGRADSRDMPHRDL